MKKLIPTTLVLFALTACGTNTEGLSSETSRGPKGNVNASVLVEEFADLQCPACRAAHASISAPVLQQYGDRIRFEFKHFPLRNVHRFALDAAYAAECAADQGKFWEYVDINFENQDHMSLDAFADWAKQAGVSDIKLFNRCIDSKIKKETILSDFQEGVDRGVNSTPTFFVNGQKIEQNKGELIISAIEQALAGASQPL